MNVSGLTINVTLAVGILASSVGGAIWVGRIAERVDNIERSNTAQWERIVAVGAKANEVDGKVAAAVQGLSGLKESIDDLKQEIRLLRQNR